MFHKYLDNEECYQVLVHSNNDAVFLHTLSEMSYFCRVLDCNNSARLLLGIPREEILSESFECVVTPLEESVQKSLLTELDKNNSVCFEAMLNMSRENKPFCSLQTFRLKSEKEAIYLTIIHDVTVWSERNRIVAESESRYHEIMENITDGIFAIDREGRLTFVNKVVVERSGYSEEQFMKLKFIDLLDSEYHQIVNANFEKTLKGETVPPYELSYRSAQGETVFLEVNPHPIYQDGKIVGVQCVSRDISSRKHIENRLFESERKFKTLTEQSLVAVGIVQHDNMIYVNDALCHISGFNQEELMSTKITELFGFIHPQDRHFVMEELRKKQQGNPEVTNHYSYRARKKDGTEVWVDQYSKTISYEEENAVLFIWVDITEQRKVEKTLRESEHKYRLLFDAAPIGICRTLLDGTILNANPAMALLLGYSDMEEMLDAISGNLLNAMVDESEQGYIIDEATSDSNVFGSEEYLRHKDGWTVICNVNGRLTRRKDSESPYFEGFYEDITERKKTELALKQNEEKFRALIENSNDIIFSVDCEGKFSYVSPQINILGKTQEEILNMDVMDLIVPEDREKTMRDFKETMQTGKEFPIQFRMYDKDGNIRWFEDFGRVMKDNKGNMIGLTGILRDITERKEAEIALSESQMTNQALLNAIPDIMFRMSREGIFLDYKTSQIDQLALSPDEFYGKNIQEILPPALATSAIENIEKTLSTGEMQAWEYSLDVPLKSGNLRNYETRMVRISESEVFVIIRDITDRKAAEKQILHSLREKEILLKEIHHRVKNNLQIISSLLHLQSRRLQDQELLEKFTECQARIQSIALIHTKLYQSKNFNTLDFGEYVQSLTTYLLRMYGSKCEHIKLENNIKHFSLDLDSAIPCGLIINELISNAIKHAFVESKGGTITLDLIEKADNQVTLIVKDDGIGLPDDFDLETTDSLGLILINSLVEQIEGTLEVGNKNGSTFKITFSRKEYPP